MDPSTSGQIVSGRRDACSARHERRRPSSGAAGTHRRPGGLARSSGRSRSCPTATAPNIYVVKSDGSSTRRLTNVGHLTALERRRPASSASPPMRLASLRGLLESGAARRSRASARGAPVPRRRLALVYASAGGPRYSRRLTRGRPARTALTSIAPYWCLGIPRRGPGCSGTETQRMQIWI